MVTVFLETVAVVAGLKSEYFTSGLAQPVNRMLTAKSKTVTSLFMRIQIGLTR